MINRISLSSGIAGALSTWLAFTLGAFPLQGNGRYQVLKELADHVTVEYVDDNAGGLAKTFRFTGVNLQIVNGLGATNGNPSSPFDIDVVETNSVGNLILGYQESSLRRAPRTGSHNLVIGADNGFDGFGGVVAGYRNTQRAPYSTAIGGQDHKTRGAYSVALGGEGHTPSGSHSVAVGGFQNRATGRSSLAGGGRHSIASGWHGTVLGGSHAKASGPLGTVVGGTGNEARGTQSVVSGGFNNLASGWRATVNGGESNTASGDHSSVAFGFDRDVSRMNQSGDTEHDGVAGSLWEDR